jgi:shikimate kinase
VTDRLLLVGMMAVGKTTIGQRCSEQLGWKFLDSDAQLVADTGRTAREIFDIDGDAALRALESQVLNEAIDEPVPVVIAVAGGVVLSKPNREMLVRSGTVIWLRASVATMSERVRLGGARPRLGDDPEQSLRDLYRARQALYASVAQFVIDVDELTPEEIVARILTESGLVISNQ